MKRTATGILMAMAFWIACASLFGGAAFDVPAYGVERFPPPDFTDHQVPRTVVPSPSSEIMEWVDVVYFITAIGLASYFALVRRSRRGLLILSLVSLGWLGFWRQGCICPIGAIQNVSLALFQSNYAIPASAAIFFAVPLIATLFFGRTFCASVCPLGAVQELVAVKPIRIPAWLDHTLGLFAYIYLGAAVLFAATGSAFVICRYDPFVGLFRLSAGANMLILGGCFLVVGVFIGRPYCRFLCPYGALLGILSRISHRHVRIPPKKCIQCRLCEDACPYNAILTPTTTLTPDERKRGRRRLGLVLVVAPFFVAGSVFIGRSLEVPLSHVNPTVRLAERMELEQTKSVQNSIDATDAFRNSGQSLASLYDEANAIKKTIRAAGGWFGGYIGLVIAAKMLHLSIRRRRTDYEPDRSFCVSCGRCFWYCPEQHVIQKDIA